MLSHFFQNRESPAEKALSDISAAISDRAQKGLLAALKREDAMFPQDRLDVLFNPITAAKIQHVLDDPAVRMCLEGMFAWGWLHAFILDLDIPLPTRPDQIASAQLILFFMNRWGASFAEARGIAIPIDKRYNADDQTFGLVSKCGAACFADPERGFLWKVFEVFSDSFATDQGTGA